MRYSPTAYPSARGFGRSLLVLPQHADQHRPERPVLLAVDQKLGESAYWGLAFCDPMHFQYAINY